MEEIFSKQRIKTTTTANDTLLFEVPFNSELINNRTKVVEDIKENFFAKIFKPEFVYNRNMDEFIEMFIKVSKVFFLSKKAENTSSSTNNTQEAFKMRPSKSSLEWAKSLGIKGGNRVPWDEDGKSWRLEKY